MDRIGALCAIVVVGLVLFGMFGAFDSGSDEEDETPAVTATVQAEPTEEDAGGRTNERPSSNSSRGNERVPGY